MAALRYGDNRPSLSRRLHFDKAPPPAPSHGDKRLIVMGITLACALGFALFMLCIIFYKTSWRHTLLGWLPCRALRRSAIQNTRRPNTINNKVVARDDLSLLFPSQDYVQASDSEKDAPSCCICLDTIEKGAAVRVLDCNHMFHSSCIADWLTRYKRKCPLCNHVIPKRATDAATGPPATVESPEPPEPAATRA